jgi:uncharacterized protein (DUF736 family)
MIPIGHRWQTISSARFRRLDDPSFPAAIYATLSETETAGEYAIIWSR